MHRPILPQSQERLWYFAEANSYFPSTFANNMQVMKMCAAFAAIGSKVTLVVPRRLATSRAIKQLKLSLWDYYAVPSNFEIAWLPFPYPFSALQRSLHALAVAVYAITHRIRSAYTRSEWVALALTQLG